MLPLALLVVVPAFNEADFVGGCLASISRNLKVRKFDYKIVVVDNGSTDNTAMVARDSGAHVLTIERSSVSYARNVGAAAYHSDYIAFVDADVVVTDEWGRALDNLMARDRSEHILTGCQYSVREEAGWVEKHWFSNLKDKHINGGNIVLSRGAFDVAGGFDEKLKTGEDYDLCERAQAKGVVYKLDASFRAIHLGYPRTLRAFFRREVWHGEGDFRSLSAFLHSPVAMIAAAYCVAVLLLWGLLLQTSYVWFGVVLVAFIVANFLLTWIRFRYCNIYVVGINSFLNAIYFFARAASFFKALAHNRKRY